MKQQIFGALALSGALVFGGCGGSSSSNNVSDVNVSSIDYAKDGFSYANLKGKNFFSLSKEKNTWVTSVVKFSDKNHTVYQKGGEGEATTEKYIINNSINGCEKGCIDVVVTDKEDNTTLDVYLKALTQDSEKISLFISNKIEDLTKTTPKVYFFFDREKLDSYKSENPL